MSDAVKAMLPIGVLALIGAAVFWLVGAAEGVGIIEVASIYIGATMMGLVISWAKARWKRY